MKPNRALRAAQRAMCRRQQCPRRPGRPRLRINEDQIIELLLAGYSRRGVAIHYGCSQRTLERRFAAFFRPPFDLTKLARHLLFRAAIVQKDPRALIYYAKKTGVCRPLEEADYMEQEE